MCVCFPPGDNTDTHWITDGTSNRRVEAARETQKVIEAACSKAKAVLRLWKIERSFCDLSERLDPYLERVCGHTHTPCGFVCGSALAFVCARSLVQYPSPSRDRQNKEDWPSALSSTSVSELCSHKWWHMHRDTHTHTHTHTIHRIYSPVTQYCRAHPLQSHHWLQQKQVHVSERCHPSSPFLPSSLPSFRPSFFFFFFYIYIHNPCPDYIFSSALSLKFPKQVHGSSVLNKCPQCSLEPEVVIMLSICPLHHSNNDVKMSHECLSIGLHLTPPSLVPNCIW